MVAKVHLESSWDVGTNFCSNSLVHLLKTNFLTLCILEDSRSSTAICWMSPFVILGV